MGVSGKRRKRPGDLLSQPPSVIVITVYCHSINMDDIRESLSRMKKGIKHRLAGKNRKPDEAQAGGRGASAEPSGSLPPQAVASGDSGRKGNEPNAEDEIVGPGAGAEENESDWKSAASASAKLLLRGVSSSSDAFGPLKSVAGGLCFILENCEVPLPPPRMSSVTLMAPAAYEGEQASDRVIGTQSQGAQ